MFRERLEEIRSRLTGGRALAIVAADGIIVEAVGADGAIDIEALAAELVAQVRTFGERQRELGAGRIEQFSVITDRYTIVLSAVAAEYYLLLVLDQVATYGRARFELRRAALSLGPDLA